MYASLGSVRGASPLSPVPPPPALNPDPDAESLLAPERRRAPRGARRPADAAPTANPPAMAAFMPNFPDSASTNPSPIPTVGNCTGGGALSTAAGPVSRGAASSGNWPLVAARTLSATAPAAALDAPRAPLLPPPSTSSPSSSEWSACPPRTAPARCCACVLSTGPSTAPPSEAPPPHESPALSSLFSRTPPTVLVLPVARSQRRAVNTLFCMLCAGCAWMAPASACGAPPPCECAGCANPPMPPNAKWGTACAGCACCAAGFPGASSAPACVEPPAESEGVGVMAPNARRGGIPRGDGFGRRGTRRTRGTRSGRPAVFLGHTRGALFPFAIASRG